MEENGLNDNKEAYILETRA